MAIRMNVGHKSGSDSDEIFDFLFDLFDLINFIIEVLRNLGAFLSRN